MVLFPALPLDALAWFTQTYLVCWCLLCFCLHPPSHQPDFITKNPFSNVQVKKQFDKTDLCQLSIKGRDMASCPDVRSMCNLVRSHGQFHDWAELGNKTCAMLACWDLTRHVVWVWLWRQVSKTKTQKWWGEAWLMWLTLGTRDICS